MLPMHGSIGAVGYDLCVARNYVTPSRGKGIVETGLAMSLPPGTCAWIVPRSRLAARNLIDVGAGIVDLDYWAQSKWYYLITLLKTL